MTRLRSKAQRPPQTRDQALPLAERFALLSAELARHDADEAALVVAAKAAGDAVKGPIKAELVAIQKQLKPWFEANQQELTDGRRKSIELGGCLIGHRIGNPTVKHTGATDAVAVTVLNAHDLDGFVRNTPSLDKPAILTALSAERQALAEAREKGLAYDDYPDAPLTALGFRSHQTETFFVDAAPDERRATEVAG